MSALDRLALRVGVEREFRDAKGELQPTSAETKRALLAAMGFSAETEARASAALTEMDREDWLRALPPVRVVRTTSGSIDFDVVLRLGTTRLDWRLTLE